MNPIIEEDVIRVISECNFWDRFKDKTILISGAAGFLPAYLVETFIYLNRVFPEQNTKVIGIVRDLAKAQIRFEHFMSTAHLRLIKHDVCDYFDTPEKIDYIIHAASQASPKYYSKDPVGTLNANILGTINLLNLAIKKNCESFLFFSSSEVYGEVAEADLPIDEVTFGYLNPTNGRSCYAESKRMGENLCVSYFQQYGVKAKIVRPFHTYGPGMLLDDGRVFADFVSDIVNQRDIILHSDGSAQRNFCYLADATVGFLKVLLNGENGEAYNVANAKEEHSIFNLASILVGLKPELNLKSIVLAERPSGQGYVKSAVSRGLPCIDKVTEIGWSPTTTVEEGFLRTINSFLINKQMEIQSHKLKFKKGEIPKHRLVENLYQYHEVLFDFAENLKDTEIEKIEISDGKVCFLTRETNHHDGEIKFIVDRNDKNTTPLTAFNFDILEKDDSEIIFKMVNKGDVVFDIGANVGWYSLHLAKKVEEGHIHSFEPIPNTFRQLAQNLALNQFENVSVNNLALADEQQTLTFYYSPQFSAAASSRNIIGSKETMELSCDAITLDMYVEENRISRIDFIKCDVEGAELFVFKGGIQTLEKYRPIVFTEMLRKWAARFDYHPNDIIRLFKELNYGCFYSAEGKMRELKTVTEETIPTNYLFLHLEKHREIIDNF